MYASPSPSAGLIPTRRTALQVLNTIAASGPPPLPNTLIVWSGQVTDRTPWRIRRDNNDDRSGFKSRPLQLKIQLYSALSGLDVWFRTTFGNHRQAHRAVAEYFRQTCFDRGALWHFSEAFCDIELRTGTARLRLERQHCCCRTWSSAMVRKLPFLQLRRSTPHDDRNRLEVLLDGTRYFRAWRACVYDLNSSDPKCQVKPDRTTLSPDCAAPSGFPI